MKHPLLVLAFVCAISTSAALAQVDVAKRQSDDKSTITLQVTISTMDRNVVPLTVEINQTQADPDTKRTESTTRARLNDGSCFDWRNTVVVQRQIDSNRTESVRNVTEKDREGGTRMPLQVKQETNKTPDGEQSTAVQYRRTSSGVMTLDRVTTAVATQNPDGSTFTTTTEQVSDVNGNLQPGRQTQATAVPVSATETQITTEVKQFDHIEGGFGVVSRETATISTTDNGTRTERLIQQPSGASWRDVGKVITTETRQPDGTLVRETVEEGRSLYSKTTPMSVDPLVPQRKIVERETAQPDGSTVVQRDIYRRDVNGDWKPVTFSTDAAAQP